MPEGGGQVSESNDGAEPRNVLTLLNRIKSGEINPRLISREERIVCAQQMFFNDMSPPQIAVFLKVSDRTIYRYRDEIYERNRATFNAELGSIMLGDYFQRTLHVIERLRTIGSNSDATTRDKIQVELSIHRVIHDRIKLAQSLGYLPTVKAKLSEVQQSAEEWQKYLMNQIEKQDLAEDRGTLKRIMKIQAMLQDHADANPSDPWYEHESTDDQAA